MKRKLLFINPSLCQGGLEHSLVEMLTVLDNDKFDFTLFTYVDDTTLLPIIPKYVKVITGNTNGHYYRHPKAIFYKIASSLFGKIKLKNFSESFSERLRIFIHSQRAELPSKTYFKNSSFDAVISNAVGLCSEMALKIRAEKRFVFYRSSVDIHHDRLSRDLPKFDAVAAVSDGVKNMLSENYPEIKDKITVIENYINAGEILRSAEEDIDIELPSAEVVISTCGRFSEEKGFDIAVSAAKILKDRGLDFVWLFIGDGAKRKMLEDQIESCELGDRIIITGFTDNPFPLIKACDIYVQPSYHESFGRSIKEAVILGKPVVSTDTVGAHTVLKNEYGEITPITAQGVADGIMTAIDRAKTSPYKKYDPAENERERRKYCRELEQMLDG